MPFDRGTVTFTIFELPEALPEIKVNDIEALAKHAEKEANPLYPVPVLMDARELERFYIEASDWRKNESSER